MISPRASYGFERPRSRGTGTIFPILNQPQCGYRPSSVEGIIQAPVRSFHSIVTSSGFPAGQSGGLPWYSDGNHSASRGNVDGSNMQRRPASSFGPRTPFQGRNRQERPASSFPPSVQPWTLYPRHR
ncbi:hypothetical protein POM88_050347 [Heracleum sosnowskyi]|uniref:Uncharacterized protein n=1 Tax=Heracleum sosnowskyi TaxID=360622 RepID=A0AAD8M1E8_9APIA|nr:hypothetical protein POM88_050347 [Heracleum sosnowskyi]